MVFIQQIYITKRKVEFTDKMSIIVHLYDRQVIQGKYGRIVSHDYFFTHRGRKYGWANKDGKIVRVPRKIIKLK